MFKIFTAKTGILTLIGTLDSLMVWDSWGAIGIGFGTTEGFLKMRILFCYPEDLDQLCLQWLRYRDLVEDETQINCPEVSNILVRDYKERVPPGSYWLIWDHAVNTRYTKFYLGKGPFEDRTQSVLLLGLVDSELVDQAVIHWLEYRGIIAE